MSIHDDVVKNMKEMAEKFAQLGVQLELPPASSRTLNTLYTEMDLGKSLAAQIKFDNRFANPLQMFQGGFLCGAFDEVFGPLTYMAAGQPVVTIEMSTSFIRPFTAKDEFITIRAEVVNKSKTLIVLKAEARSKAGKLIATSTNHSLVLSEDQMLRNAK